MRKFELITYKEFNFPELKNKNFFFKNLEESPIALNFNLVKTGVSCDYAMP